MSLVARNQPIHGAPGLVGTFGILQGFGFVGSILILVTVLFAPSVRRHPTWISFCASWVISSLTYLLLFFGGLQNHDSLTGRNPICMTQAALIYAVPVLVTAALLSLVVQLWQTVMHVTGKSSRKNTALLLILPYVAFLVITVALLAAGATHPEAVVIKEGIYCGFNNKVPGDLSPVIVIILMVITLYLEAKIAKTVFRSSKGLHTTSHSSLSEQFPVGMLVRVLVFNVFSILGIISGAFFLSHNAILLAIANLFLAFLPAAFVLTFGTQRDILMAWKFWDRKPVPPPKDVLPTPTSSIEKV